MHQSSIRFALPLLAGLAFASVSQVRAGDTRSFIIPQRDGYGIGECLGKKGDCGRVVADSWCEAHGMSKAASYGLAEDVTAAIPRSASAPTKSDANERSEPGSYVINCES